MRNLPSTFCVRRVEDICRAPWPIPLHITLDRILKQNLPSEHRWVVRAAFVPAFLWFVVRKNGDWHLDRSGSVCLDMINETWSPMFGGSTPSWLAESGFDSGACLDVTNIFEIFLPQLLHYPNPHDPLNGEAASLFLRHPQEYDTKVKGAPWKLLDNVLRWFAGTECVQQWATKEIASSCTWAISASQVRIMKLYKRELATHPSISTDITTSHPLSASCLLMSIISHCHSFVTSSRFEDTRYT